MPLLSTIENIPKAIEQYQKKNALEEQKRQQEQQKLQLEIFKQWTEGKKTDAELEKLKADTLDVATKTIGQEWENREKKVGLFDYTSKVLGGFAPSAIPKNLGLKTENQKATADAKNILQSVRKASPEDIKAQLDKALKEQAGSQQAKPPQRQPAMQQPLPLPPQVITDRINLPPPPFADVTPALSAIEDQKRRITEGATQREQLLRDQQVITDHFEKSFREYQARRMRNLEIQRNLAENPPTYRSALSNVGWFKTIIGIIDAARAGHLHENPSHLFDTYVAKELADQQKKHTEKKAFLKDQATMYDMFFEEGKDVFEAQSSVRSLLYKGIGDQIELQEKLVTNEQQAMQLKALNADTRRKSAVEEHKLNQAMKEQASKQAMRRIDTHLKQRKFGLEQLKTAMKLGTGAGGIAGQLKPTERVDRLVRFGGVDYYDIPKDQLTDKKTGVRLTLSSKKEAVRKITELQGLLPDITPLKGLKALTADLPYTKIGEKEKRVFDTLNKNLIDIMLTYRITFSGGGKYVKSGTTLVERLL